MVRRAVLAVAAASVLSACGQSQDRDALGAVQQPLNLLANGGMEAESGVLAGWTRENNSGHYSLSTTALDGTTSLALASERVRSSVVPVRAGERYTASVHLLGGTGGLPTTQSDVAVVALVWVDSSGATIGQHGPSVRPAYFASWRDIRVTATAPAGAAGARILMGTYFSNGTPILFDAASLQVVPPT